MRKTLITIVSLMFMGTLFADAQNLKKSITWNKLNDNPAALPQIGRLTPHPSTLDMQSWWSVGVETLDRDFADFDKFADFIPETGVGYGRLQSGWAKTEKVKGQYNFDWIEAHVEGLRNRGVKPWICLCYGNPIYSEHGFDLNAKLFPDGPVMDGWLNYVRETVKRFKGRVPMYEIWNEPDGSSLESYDLYANLCVRTAKVIHEEDPAAKIAAFGICQPNRPYIRQGLAKMKELGGIELIDYITYHAYRPVPEACYEDVKQLLKDAKSYSPRIELLQGECGCPAQLEYGHALSFREWTEYSQAKWDLRFQLTNYMLSIPSSIFTMVDLNYGWMLQSFGLVRMNLKSQPIYKRPKFYAIQNLTSVVTAQTLPVQMDIQSNSKKALTSVGLSRNGKTVGFMVWFGGEQPNDSLERTDVSIKTTGIDATELVYVDMMTGKVHDLSGKYKLKDGKLSMKSVPVWDAPVLIIEKSAIDFTANN